MMQSELTKPKPEFDPFKDELKPVWVQKMVMNSHLVKTIQEVKEITMM